MDHSTFLGLILPPVPLDAELAPLELEGRELVIGGGDPVPFMAPLFAGAAFDWICLGVVLCQTQWWSVHYHERSPWIIRGLVYLLFLVSLTMSGYSLYFTLWGTVQQYATYWQFLDKTRSSTIFVIYAISRFPVGIFFGHRAWRLLGRSKVFLVAISVLAIASIAGSIMGKIYFSSLVTSRNVIRLASFSLVVWLGCEVLSDLLITVSIAVCLYRSRTGWSGTDRLITKLLIMVIETQLPPTMFALAFMLVFFGAQSNTRYLIIFMGAPKVHVICVLAVLNRKDKFRSQLNSSGGYYRSKSSFALASEGGGITVQTETVQAEQRIIPDAHSHRFTNRQPSSGDGEYAETGHPHEHPAQTLPPPRRSSLVFLSDKDEARAEGLRRASPSQLRAQGRLRAVGLDEEAGAGARGDADSGSGTRVEQWGSRV